MNDERIEVPSPSIGFAASANLDQEAGSPENARLDVTRRGFLGKVLAALAAGAAGLWSWRRPTPAEAFFCTTCNPTPTPILDYTAATTNLINNMVANFNAHNAQAVVNIFSSALNTSQMLSSMGHAFTAFPNLTLTVTSMSVTNLGRVATINYSMTGTHEVAVADALVVTSGSGITYTENVAQPETLSVTGASDTVTGTNTFRVFNGGLITGVTGSSTVASVFAAHGAQIVAPS